MAFVKIAKLNEFPVGKVVGKEVNGKKIVVVNYGGEYFALDGTCTHEQCELREGHLEGSKLTCICHGGQFEVKTGEAVTLPVVTNVQVYETRVVGEELEVEIR